MELNLPSPLQKLTLGEHEVWIKRDDLIHPQISGNKWRKLKYNIEHFKQSKKTSILTFGGAFSNHLYATAAACRAFNIKCIGIVRGLEVDLTNPTLAFCSSHGMEIISISREDYKLKSKAQRVETLINERQCFVIPEGGNNALGLQGAKETMEEMLAQLPSSDFVVCCAIGTGTTLKGLLSAAPKDVSFIGFMATQDKTLEDELTRYKQLQLVRMANPYRRFGKMDENLASYINSFFKRTSIPLDPLYNGKMMYTFEEQIARTLNQTKPIVFLHTGGLQGVDGYNYRFKDKVPIG